MTEKFRGRYSIKIDSKSRLAWHTEIRNVLNNRTRLVITNSLFKGAPHLDVYPIKQWEALENEIDRLPALRPEVQSFQRFYLAGGTPVDVDGQGRILVPYELRQYAQLKSDVIIIGMGERIEIWDKTHWAKVFQSFKNDFDSLLSKISELKGDGEKK